MQQRIALVGGGGAGIGRAVAEALAASGHRVVVTGRKPPEVTGGIHPLVADIGDPDTAGPALRAVAERFGEPDILVLNAGGPPPGRILDLGDDDWRAAFELLLLGPLRLARLALPGMAERHRGHIINISSIGVLTNAPRFSAYVSSKAALDAFSRCAQAEFSDNGINFTTINMPLVKTPMIAPTKMYESVPTLSPDEAADMIVDAIIQRPVRMATRLGTFAQIFYALAPRAYEILMNTAFRLFPDSAAAKGMKGRGELDKQPTSEQVAFASLMRGVHW